MIYFRRVLTNLIFNKIWGIYLYINLLYHSVKDYNNQLRRYDDLIKSSVKTKQNGIDLYKLEIIDLIDSGKTIEEIKKYLMS